MTDEHTDDSKKLTDRQKLSAAHGLGVSGDGMNRTIDVPFEQFDTVRIDHDGETYTVVKTDDGLALERVEADE